MKLVNSTEQVNELKKDHDMLLMYFGSDACGVCRDMMPKIENMLAKYPNIEAIKIDAENSLELSASYNVFTVPVIILFIQGKETLREARIISVLNLEQKISRYYDLFHESDSCIGSSTIQME